MELLSWKKYLYIVALHINRLFYIRHASTSDLERWLMVRLLHIEGSNRSREDRQSCFKMLLADWWKLGMGFVLHDGLLMQFFRKV